MYRSPSETEVTFINMHMPNMPKDKWMKKLIYITITLLSIWSCAQFDDSKIWDKFQEHENREKQYRAVDII